MKWTLELVKYWCENYQSLIDYELNPFEEIFFIKNKWILRRDILNVDSTLSGDLISKKTEDIAGISGSRKNSAPYEDTCDLNWEFDKALKKLGSKEKEFRRLYIDGEGEDLTLFNEFVRILMEVSDEI